MAALEVLVHRGPREAEPPRDVGHGRAVEVTEQQDVALPRIQSQHGGGESLLNLRARGELIRSGLAVDGFRGRTGPFEHDVEGGTAPG